ncbi:MAG: biotin--[acetyl-CoA-carboxylase] ligase [bacterium]
MEQEDVLLRLLSTPQNDYISGEQLSRALGVSRTAIWKYITELRNSGYVVEAQPRLGYRLVSRPDKLLPAEVRVGLRTRLLGQVVEYHERVDSTNNRGKELAFQGAEEGTLVVAEEQTGGRGRRGRAWSSPPGTGIWVSLVLRPNFQPSQAPLLTLTAAVAAAEAVRDLAGVSAGIKWPNDILAGGRKLAGILTEMNAELDVINHVVLGIGINVNTPAFPEDIAAVATSLFLERGGKPVSRVRLLQSFLERFESWYDRLPQAAEQLLQRWRELSVTLGQNVTVTSPAAVLAGVARDVDSEGALLLETEDGQVVRVLSGDVSLRPRQAVHREEFM